MGTHIQAQTTANNRRPNGVDDSRVAGGAAVVERRYAAALQGNLDRGFHYRHRHSDIGELDMAVVVEKITVPSQGLLPEFERYLERHACDDMAGQTWE
ncbi:hypothetical protein U1763_10560 [Sphingomonas sp. LB2R24]|uniref:hypothetical protein n=1 Tax=Sphingomonas sorbitolis TaxID=3096165 RepID=UPI002FC5EDF3